jgi:transglutaminase-like putative cysteine protease
MVLLTTTVSVVPGGTAEPVQLLGGDADGETLEGSLVSADQRVSIQGAIELSPELRFTVESNRESYWRAAAYDRYTGGGWVRTGSEARYEGPLSGPPGRSRTISQRYTVEAPVDVMPAAWRPVRVSGTDNALVTAARGLRPAEPFTGGETYEVESQRPVARPADLATAGTDYPEELAATYTQLPDSTPDRVRERTDRITANADTPYETARVVERWLENNRRYSLDIERPSGDVADAFLFEMEAGYCTYYSTTMVTMLRSQGIPARFVVGYTSGEQVGDGEWEVRGLDSHAWVEVYFPDTGWVRFDPTPGGPREAAEQARLGQTNGTDPANAAALRPAVFPVRLSRTDKRTPVGDYRRRAVGGCDRVQCGPDQRSGTSARHRGSPGDGRNAATDCRDIRASRARTHRNRPRDRIRVRAHLRSGSRERGSVLRPPNVAGYPTHLPGTPGPRPRWRVVLSDRRPFGNRCGLYHDRDRPATRSGPNWRFRYR